MRRIACVALAAWMVGCVDQMTEPAPAAAPPAHAPRKFGVFDPIDVPSASTDISVLDGDSPGSESEALGVVAYSNPNRTGAREMMRTRAAVLGAEGITSIKSVGGRWVATAVRCRALRDGREYDVLEQIDVPVKDGREDAAFDDLRSRA